MAITMKVLDGGDGPILDLDTAIRAAIEIKGGDPLTRARRPSNQVIVRQELDQSLRPLDGSTQRTVEIPLYPPRTHGSGYGYPAAKGQPR